MLTDFGRVVAYQILAYIAQRIGAERVPPGNPAGLPLWLQNLIEAYWDWVTIYRDLLPKLPTIEVEPIDPWPPQPQPGPSPMHGGLVRDFLLLDVLEHAMGDPNPQPNSWIHVLGNKQIRINSAKKLRDHLKKAIPQLEAEAKRLEKLQ